VLRVLKRSFLPCLQPLKQATLIRSQPLAPNVVKKKGNSELRRLSCSINYEANSSSASRGRVKGRSLSMVIYEAQVVIVE
jgi:hypothetical protein